MKIVEIIPSLSKRAGAEVFMINLSKAFSENNEVFVISLYDGIDSNIKNELDDSNIKVLFCAKKVGVDYKCAKTLKKHLDEIKPDVVHMHLNCIVTYFLAYGFIRPSFNAFLTIHSLIKKDFRFLERFLIRKYSKKKLLSLVGISDLITKDAINNFKKSSISTIYNGTKLFRPLEEENNNDTFSIVCVAAFREEKNQQLLLDVCHNIVNYHKKNIKLVFVGDGPTLLQIKQRSEKYSDLNVVFAGQQTNVEPYLLQSNLFCLSSIYEGNPISIIEAMSVGLPIIAPRVGGIPDIIKDNVNGLMFSVNDINDCAEKIICLIDNNKLRAKIRMNNIDESHKYEIHVCANQYINLFIDKNIQK